ncbi:ABC transporter substrate-binding protein [Paenibacillus sp. LHD-117]|uniref:ABC transporter substrate-binding protein n=1 Tax=Paenibacillus sp. LHD-117 TaxID=3071412 RepID=UPI0027DF6EF4|nr:ABC transporter substrate-binding protein [Paenibacillus sp. LHD-117]MDQ6421438.1 ABC transporter substrate-binding protein [Paenibacillus sp. LHD-117]
MKKLSTMLISLSLVSAMIMSGCSNADSNSTNNSKNNPSAPATETKAPDKENEKPVELNFYMMNGPVNESDRIMKKANEIIEEKINAKLNFVMIDGSTYAEKMNLMINSGDDWDLAFTAFWGGINFFENAAKGAYADLTDLLPTLAPETYSRIPQGLWDGVKVDGKIYASVNYQQYGVAKRNGFYFREDVANEVGFDWKAVKGKPTIEALQLIGPFLGDALAKHPDMIGWETSSIHSFFANEPLYWNMEPVGDLTTPGWINLDDPTKVINQFETPEFAQYAEIMRDWYNKGYVRKDGATVKDTSPDRKAGKMIAAYGYGWPDSVDLPGQVFGMSMTEAKNAPAVSVSTTRTLISAGAGSNAAIAVNSESKNIEKAVQLIELLNTDDDLYKLITLGEKDVDYKFDENGNFTQLEGKYNFNWNDWQIGQSYSPTFNRNEYNQNEAGEMSKKAMTIVYENDKTADVSPLSGFVFDPSPVKTQIANVSSVTSEMIPAISNGSIDPTTAVPKFLERLKTAGVDDIIKEKQAQYDAWRSK